uniref:GPI transamidase component PIG-T n=1 Tax=Angiostrongylus cantonensis TaxID=6313 RepID=A0A158P9L2_ANGCA
MQLLCAFYLLINFVNGDWYTEELKITRLAPGNLMAEFRFRIASDNLELGPKYSLFPRIVAELTNAHSISEISFLLTQGRWYSSRWGLPPQPNGPTGASIHAWLRGNETHVDTKWRTLINSLNGLLCTAMTRVVPEQTSSPRLAFRRIGSSTEPMVHLRYSAVGKETICTENMTPWKKLLPCKQHGLVTLLNPIKLFESVYHSVGFQLYPACKGLQCYWLLDLVVNTVFDIPLKTGKLDWNFSELFNREMTGVCNVASSSKVVVKLNEKNLHLIPKPTEIVDELYAVYDLQKIPLVRAFSIHGLYNHMFDSTSRQGDGSISVSSSISGTDQQSAVLISILKNEGTCQDIIYTHQLPWFLLIYYHTLSLTCRYLTGRPEQVVESPILYKHYFVPSLARKRPALLELQFELPGYSECRLQLEFEKAFLRIREYPPDANHGMYIPGAVVTLLGSNNTSTRKHQDQAANRGMSTCESRLSCNPVVLHGNVLLITLPVPDFSMPFNVICFVMTTVNPDQFRAAELIVHEEGVPRHLKTDIIEHSTISTALSLVRELLLYNTDFYGDGDRKGSGSSHLRITHPYRKSSHSSQN